MIEKYKRKMASKFSQRRYKARSMLSGEIIQSHPYSLNPSHSFQQQQQQLKSMYIKLLPFCTELKGEDTESKMRSASHSPRCGTPSGGTVAFP